MLCSFWKKSIQLEELLAVNNEAEKLAWTLQADAGTVSLLCQSNPLSMVIDAIYKLRCML